MHPDAGLVLEYDQTEARRSGIKPLMAPSVQAGEHLVTGCREFLQRAAKSLQIRTSNTGDLAARNAPRYKPRDFDLPIETGKLSDQSQ
jgi:hypothetical protein